MTRGIVREVHGFATFIVVVLGFILFFFLLFFTKQIYTVFFVNAKIRQDLHNKIHEVMRKPHGLNFLLENINTALLVEEVSASDF